MSFTYRLRVTFFSCFSQKKCTLKKTNVQLRFHCRVTNTFLLHIIQTSHYSHHSYFVYHFIHTTNKTTNFNIMAPPAPRRQAIDINFCNTAFTPAFFARYYSKLYRTASSFQVFFEQETTTLDGKRDQRHLLSELRDLLNTIQPCRDEAKLLLEANTPLTPAKRDFLGFELQRCIGAFARLSIQVLESACHIDTQVSGFQVPGLDKFFHDYPLLTESKVKELKQLNVLRNCRVHSPSAYSAQAESCKVTHSGAKYLCSNCHVYVPLLEQCRNSHKTTNWRDRDLSRFLGAQTDSPTSNEMDSILNKPFLEHAAIENFLWSSPFFYSILFDDDSCIRAAKLLIHTLYLNGFPERHLEHPGCALGTKTYKKPFNDRKI